jgi:hypothetical protein
MAKKSSSLLKFKKGDTVQVKPKEWWESLTANKGLLNPSSQKWISPFLPELAGKIVTVVSRRAYKGVHLYMLTGGIMPFPEEMFDLAN